MKIYLALMFFCLWSCQSRQDKNTASNKIDTTQKKQAGITLKYSIRPEEVYIDSMNIGIKKRNKVEVFKYRTKDSNYVNVKFYTKQNDNWRLNQTIHFFKDGVVSCDTKFSDFNNDGHNDMTIVSSTAGRGANEIRSLFIYDKSTDKLTQMKNSENYPNMLYNKELDCIDAFLVYAGSSTVFLKISGDSLKEFASAEAMDGLTVREFDKNGKGKIIFRDTAYKNNYIRFKTYKPLTAYDEY